MLRLITEFFDPETGEKKQMPILVTLKEKRQNKYYFECWIFVYQFISDAEMLERHGQTILTEKKIRQVKTGYVL